MRAIKPVIHILSVLLVLLSTFMTFPVIFLALGDHSDWRAFVLSASVTLFAALLGLGLSRGPLGHLRQKQMFLLTATAWIVLPLFASLPLILSNLGLSYTDAIFESVSGITTTGSTILTGLDALPDDILLWRSIVQWMGGFGIIGMAVAILPFLRVGGMKLFATESSEWSDKALPRTNSLAHGLVVVYLGLTLLCGLLYWLAGMDAFNAVNHALTTLSTGGFSTSDSSMGQFNSLTILWISTVFMALGGMPFFLFVRAINGQYLALWRDEQVRFFVKTLVGVALVIGVHRAVTQDVDLLDALTAAFFNVTSVVTTTGYASEDYTVWGHFSIAFFLFLTFVGGCSGSTSGGMKIFRFQLSLLLLREQIIRLMHPRAVLSRRFNRRSFGDEIIASSVAFSFIYLATLALMTLILAALGLDLVTSLTGAATALGNVGPGLGNIIGPAGTFQSLPDAAKWVLSAGMLLGRLELLSVVVLLSPDFWRK